MQLLHTDYDVRHSLPDRGVFGSEFSGVPFEVVDVVEPSLESMDNGLRVSSVKSPLPRGMLEAYVLFVRAGAWSNWLELVPKMSLDPPPGGFSTLKRG